MKFEVGDTEYYLTVYKEHLVSRDVIHYFSLVVVENEPDVKAKIELVSEDDDVAAAFLVSNLYHKLKRRL